MVREDFFNSLIICVKRLHRNLGFKLVGNFVYELALQLYRVGDGLETVFLGFQFRNGLLQVNVLEN